MAGKPASPLGCVGVEADKNGADVEEAEEAGGEFAELEVRAALTLDTCDGALDEELVSRV